MNGRQHSITEMLSHTLVLINCCCIINQNQYFITGSNSTHTFLIHTSYICSLPLQLKIYRPQSTLPPHQEFSSILPNRNLAADKFAFAVETVVLFDENHPLKTFVRTRPSLTTRMIYSQNSVASSQTWLQKVEQH